MNLRQTNIFFYPMPINYANYGYSDGLLQIIDKYRTSQVYCRFAPLYTYSSGNNNRFPPLCTERNNTAVGKGRGIVTANWALPEHRKFDLIALWMQGFPQRAVTIDGIPTCPSSLHLLREKAGALARIQSSLQWKLLDPQLWKRPPSVQYAHTPAQSETENSCPRLPHSGFLCLSAGSAVGSGQC